MANTELNNYDAFNRELILDLTLGAFSIYDMDHADYPVIRDYLEIPTYYKTVTATAIYSGNDPILDGLGNPVTVDRIVLNNRSTDEREEKFKFLVTSSTSFTVGEYNDYRFLDWYSYDTTGTDYSSYLITGYLLTQEMMRRKQAIYLNVFCKLTESTYTTGSGNTIRPTRQSSCWVQSQWEWNNSTAQGKWGTAFQAYRLFKNLSASPAAGDAFDYGDTVVVTKNKLRGRGRALSLYIYSEIGKDLKLLGWGLEVTANDTP